MTNIKQALEKLHNMFVERSMSLEVLEKEVLDAASLGRGNQRIFTPCLPKIEV